MLEWLLDPRAEHGIGDLAARIVQTLWQRQIAEPVKSVKRQYQLGSCYPDLGIQFEASLLLIENKVNAGALRPGQLNEQHERALSQQAGRPLYHVLLCPDRLPVTGLVLDSPAFAVLTYGRLAALLRGLATPTLNAEAGVIIRQYAEFIGKSLGSSTPTGIRMATGSTIARRNVANGAWSEEEFMAVAEAASADNRARQEELLDLIRSMECIESRFDGQGPTNPTYKVYLAGTNIHVLWVYADGKLFPSWELLRNVGQHAAADAWKQRWGNRIRRSNVNNSFVDGGLEAVGALQVVQNLQVLADSMNSGSVKG